MPNVISADVEWNFEVGNLPYLKLTLDEFPKYGLWSSLSFQSKTIYWTCDGDFANFLAEVPGDRNGFGGRTFELNMMDGTTRKVVGPWSSRTGVMARLLGVAWLEVGIKTVDSCYHYGVATLDFVKRQVLPMMDIVIYKLKAPYGEITYCPALKYNHCYCNKGFWGEQTLKEDIYINANGRCTRCKHKIFPDERILEVIS